MGVRGSQGVKSEETRWGERVTWSVTLFSPSARRTPLAGGVWENNDVHVCRVHLLLRKETSYLPCGYRKYFFPERRKKRPTRT